MSQNDVNTPEQEVNNAPEETVNDEQAHEAEEQEETSTEDEPTAAELHEEDTQKIPENVPKARLDKEIQRRKDLEAKLAELEKAKDNDPEVDDTQKDPDVKELAEKISKIEQKENKLKREEIFQKHYEKALENAPEYKDVANAEVVKQLAFNPANKDKTYSQLLDMAYGNALGGKRTTETTTPRGGADTKVDVERARKDPEYRKEVLSNDETRKQYNESLTDRVGRYL